MYAPDSDKPYSGEVVSYYSNGQKEKEGTFKDGKEDGLWIYYNEDGTVKELKEY
jgi:antitoxin component YwqK of YwqJK toxin-antitoxin module